MSMLSFEEFLRHPKFTPFHGLCSNINMIYSHYTGKCFERFLYKNDYVTNYPVGIGDFVHINDPLNIKLQSRDLYYVNREKGTLYVNAQYGLRKRLYEQFCEYNNSPNQRTVSNEEA